MTAVTGEIPGYVASPWQQRFHNLAHWEALGAGSAGPGKTRCLIYDPFAQIFMEHRRCETPKSYDYHIDWGGSCGWALHLRRTLKTVEQTIQYCLRTFPRIDPDVHWDSAKTTFTFSSGFRYQFGHCKERNSYEDYMSSAYCVAKGTRILMGDGSYRAIEEICAGDRVSTLEGPRRVTASVRTGRKPTVELSIHVGGAIVGRQRHPTTHPVLLWSNCESQPEQWPSIPRSGVRARPRGLYWQDYESLLYGRPESPVVRVSAISEESASGAFGGALVGVGQLPRLSVPVALHGPSVRRAAQRLADQSTRSRGHGTSLEPSACLFPSGPPPLGSSHSDLQPEFSAAQSRAGSTAALTAYGSACGEPDRRTPEDLTDRCSSSPRSHDEQPLLSEETCLGSARPRADAVERIPTGCSVDGRAETRTDSRCTEQFYPHFYTGKARSCSEELLIGTAEMAFAGFEETFDLTVEGANHYISDAGVVNANTHLGFDELTAFEQEQYEQIRTRCRTDDPVLRKMLKIRAMSNPVMRVEAGDQFSVSNPHWVRDYFVAPCREGNTTLTRYITLDDGTVEKRTRIYLPARLSDNPNAQFRRDYEISLQGERTHIRQALLRGDWYVVPGGFFSDDWNAQLHTCKPFALPPDWPVFRSMDWGYKQPGCVGWFAMDPDENLFMIRELTFQGKKDVEVAKMIEQIERDMKLWQGKRSLLSGPADWQLWEERGDSGKTKAQVMAENGVGWIQCEKTKQTNAARLLDRMKDHDDGTTTPGIVFFNTCRKSIETIPMIQTDPNNPELPLDGGPDHWFDMTLYACAFASRGRKGIGRTRRTNVDRDEDRDEDREPKRTGSYYGAY